MSVEARLKKHSIINTASGCWLWNGATDPDGYGQISVEGKTKQAHFASWEAKHGPVPAGLEIDHLCRQRNCVNPEHLEAVTHAENVRRAAVAQRKIKINMSTGGVTVESPIDETESKLMAVLRIDPAKCEGFRLDDLTPLLSGMLERFG